MQTSVLLLVIGVAVTELASWGRRQQSRASQQQGYLEGILQSTGALATGGWSAPGGEGWGALLLN